MSRKKLIFRDGARRKLLRGAKKLSDAGRITLGPRCKCVLIQKDFGKPLICNDGVTIAKEFELSDPEESLGAQIIRSAAEQTADSVGDGTTTSTLLAYRIFREGLRNVTAGASAVALKRGLERGLRVAVEEIRRSSRPISNQAESAAVATVAAHNDPTIGARVAEALSRVG